MATASNEKTPGDNAPAIEPAEWLLHLPKDFVDYREDDYPFGVGDRFCGLARVLTAPKAKRGTRRPMWQFDVATSTLELRVTYFGKRPEHTTDWKDVKPGARILLKGTINQFGRQFVLDGAERVSPAMYGRIAARYRRGALKRAASATVAKRVAEALEDERHLERASELLHERLGAASPGPAPLNQLLLALHAPDCERDGHLAIQRARQLSALSILKRRPPPVSGRPGACVAIEDWLRDRAVRVLEERTGFSLSESQLKAIHGLVDALRRDQPTRALISGDVGSGKTLPYLALAVLAHTAGARVAVMIPNGVLAEQVFRECQEVFPRVNATLVSKGGLKGDRDTGLLIGTTAISAYAKRSGWRADVLILDEQQKLGLTQKQQVMHEDTNVIEATATCIPMTMGQIKHGDMDIYRLKPHTEKDIRSYILGEQDRARLVDHIEKEMAEGRRCAVIYPIRNQDTERKRSVIHAAEAWAERFPGQVACLHGQMTQEEKTAILQGVRDKDTPLLVASSIIEVGVTIPDLSTLIVVDAGRYGTSTLHQMRGRLVRQGGKGFFFMLPGVDTRNSDALTDGQVTTLERLSLLLRTQDGFELAELDMAQRGFGDLFSEEAEKQHGATQAPFYGLKLTPEDFDGVIAQENVA
ncbi:helicase-related protein [Thioalkalivibrio sp. ALMg11]|uniref:helicase-related protein n=1 Tax=Thioalkalivibrio sp. ALMg11 TaxID=1158165 RepID=UPI0003629744|nr:helicase-related protein [Thioalkalivibrio sp. ALMg11]